MVWRVLRLFMFSKGWFFFHVVAAGELSVRVIDSILGMQPALWEFIGKTGPEEESWQQVNLTIGARKHRFQVSLVLKISIPEYSSIPWKHFFLRGKERICNLFWNSLIGVGQIFPDGLDRLHLSQLAFEARAVKLSPPTMIRVRNVGFLNCYAGYFPLSPTGEHSK